MNFVFKKYQTYFTIILSVRTIVNLKIESVSSKLVLKNNVDMLNKYNYYSSENLGLISFFEARYY